MSIKEEYIEEVKRDLENLEKNLNQMDAWKKEIEVLEEKINAYKNGGFGLGIQSNVTITIDDIVDKDETRLNTVKSNIEHTIYKLKEYKACLECLSDNEYGVINKRYLVAEYKNKSYDGIAKDMKFSKTHISRLHDSAIKKIADYKHRSVGIANMIRIGKDLGYE